MRCSTPASLTLESPVHAWRCRLDTAVLVCLLCACSARHCIAIASLFCIAVIQQSHVSDSLTERGSAVQLTDYMLCSVQFLGAVLFRKQIAIVTELMPLGDLHSALSGGRVVWGPRCVVSPPHVKSDLIQYDLQGLPPISPPASLLSGVCWLAAL